MPVSMVERGHSFVGNTDTKTGIKGLRLDNLYQFSLRA